MIIQTSEVSPPRSGLRPQESGGTPMSGLSAGSPHSRGDCARFQDQHEADEAATDGQTTRGTQGGKRAMCRVC